MGDWKNWEKIVGVINIKGVFCIIIVIWFFNKFFIMVLGCFVFNRSGKIVVLLFWINFLI